MSALAEQLTAVGYSRSKEVRPAMDQLEEKINAIFSRKDVGRSRKQLNPIVVYQGGVYIARWEGRRDRFFGRTHHTDALKNLRSSEQ